MPQLILNGTETPQFIHAHENSEKIALQGPAKSILIYAQTKKEIEYLQELLQNDSIKEKPTLYFDLTKILSREQSSLGFLSSLIDSITKDIIQSIQTQLRDWEGRSEQNYQELKIPQAEKEKENSSPPFSPTSSLAENL